MIFNITENAIKISLNNTIYLCQCIHLWIKGVKNLALVMNKSYLNNHRQTRLIMFFLDSLAFGLSFLDLYEMYESHTDGSS